MTATARHVETVVVGGGAAGMVAAISAARGGHSVVVLEGNQQLGRKILISGNGRCNLTNLDADAPVHYHGGNPRFVRPALEGLPVKQTLAFFRDLGIETKVEKRQRLFPISDQAQSVVDVLADHMTRLGVEVCLGAKASGLEALTGGGFRVHSVVGHDLRADRVILASGGISVAKLGADASGMDLACGLGHTRTRLWPGLVPLISPDKSVHRMQGVRLWARVSADLPSRCPVWDEDDLLLTKYGVSGFAVLNLSARLVPALERGPVDLSVNLFPGRTAEQMSESLKLRWQRHGHRTLALSFAGLLHSRVVGPFLQRLGLSPERAVASVTKAERWRLAQELTTWRITVSEPHSFDHAEVTIGGIDTAEIDPETLESYAVPGLYFAGEMVDVHGDLGGFNFHWAWASGHRAGARLGS